MQDFKKLRVWNEALTLVLNVDNSTKRWRRGRHGALRNQAFRAALSITANIAEGRRKKTDKEFARLLNIAAGSSSELESHLIVGREAGIILEDDFVALTGQTIRVRKMLFALMRRISDDG